MRIRLRSATITITASSTPRRRKPREGDEKTVKGITYVRKQMTEKWGGAVVFLRNSRGQPVFEWVKKEVDSVQKP